MTYLIVDDGVEREATPEEIADIEQRRAQGADIATFKGELVESVNAVIAAIYARWMRFDAEYIEREAAARSFAAGGYVGDPGTWVSSFAVSADKTNQQAADLIIAQADALRAALEALGSLRMTKYAILKAEDKAAAQAVHDSILTQAAAIAATLS